MVATKREKGRDLTCPMTKAPISTKCQKSKGEHQNATKLFDYTVIADLLRTVSWSNYSHQTGVVYQVS